MMMMACDMRLALLRQKAGGWHVPFYQTSLTKADKRARCSVL